MAEKFNSVNEYLDSLPDDRRKTMQELRKVIKKNLPEGFSECISYGMIGYVVPHKIYPEGYHCDPALPLPFLSLASQKNAVTVYHMGLYADPAMLKWFNDAYVKATGKKPDMGKSCIRFKKPEDIPMELLGKLASKMTPEKWVSLYKKAFRK
jgi:uncharacterized protein YdhG (YjbR/CyaY superfamily)